MSSSNNPANQIGECDYPNPCPACGSFAGFCSIDQGVKAYTGLLIKGYPHVAEAWALCGQPGYGDLAGAATALGQGFYNFRPVADGFCGGPATISASTPRIWDAGRYDDGGGPGSAIIDTINHPSNAD
jgi:hypothetical protein